MILFHFKIMDLDFGIFFIYLIVLGLTIPNQGEVYYVTPTEPPNPECPGDPCQTIDFYIANEDTYFKNKTNLSLHLLRGIHNVTSKDSQPVLVIKDLLSFLMIGAQNSNDVLVCFSIIFIRVDTAVIKNLMFSEYQCSNFPSIAGTDSPRSLIIVDSSIQGIVLSFVHNTGENSRSVELIRSVFSSDVSVAFIFSKLIKSIYLKQNQFKAKGCVFQQNEFVLTMKDGAIDIKKCKFLDADVQINAENVSILLSGEVWFFHSHHTVIFASLSTVMMSGNTSFINILKTPVIAYLSTISISGDCKFLNNGGKNGGALALYSSVLKVGLNTKLYFVNNSATDTGGALYVSGSILDTTAQFHLDIDPANNRNDICFYQLLEYSSNQANYSITFKENTAKRGGDHIYGASLNSACTVAYEYDNFLKTLVAVKTSAVQRFFKLEPNLTTTMSPVSSNPRRICVCDSDGKPQCAEMSKLFVSGLSVYPGETFTLCAAVVGGDFGTTTGTIHANFPSTNLNQEHTSVLKPASQYSQWTTSHEFCDRLVYSLYSRRAYQLMYLTAIDMASNAAMQYNSRDEAEIFIETWYKSLRTIQPYLLNTPVFINITLLPCPLGFLLIGDPPGCECHPVLAESDFICELLNKTGYLSWKGLVWVGTFNDNIMWNTSESNESNGLTVAYFCPPDYCKADYKSIDLYKYPDSQCIFNHAGRLCGGCRESYSLAVGSSRCIYCSNKNYLTLFIFFSFAGVLLVFFIGILNLTVTQGMINGLIFYANIIWAYENLLFPQTETNIAVLFLKTFIAWLNLDFGIESCLFQGLNAFWKTLLQYIFPIYIWSIAGFIIISTRHSSLLTKIIGNRAVPVLTTLFLLSYMKLLRTTVSSIRFHIIYVLVNNHSRLVVWSLDGRYEYCHFPHLILFIAAISTMLLLWLPYTLLLLLIQWLRKVSHYRIFRWLTRFSPVYDAHFAPLKTKHQYWFGVLLLVRGILLVIFSATYTVLPNANLFLLLIIIAFALSYTNYKRVYKHKSVQILETLFLFALIPVGAAGLIGSEAKYIILYVSISFSFLIFCGIVVWSILKSCCCKVTNKNEEQVDDNHDSHLHAQLRNSNFGATEYTKFRDSILEEFVQPINTNVNSIATY